LNFTRETQHPLDQLLTSHALERLTLEAVIVELEARLTPVVGLLSSLQDTAMLVTRALGDCRACRGKASFGRTRSNRNHL
jgi:hypothetical protein